MVAYDDEERRDDIHTRKAERLEELEYDIGSYRRVALFGVVFLAFAVWMDWLTLVWLRDVFRGEPIVPADEEPWSAWLGLLLGFLMIGLCNVLGVRMLLHARTQRRRTARLAERLRRVGRGGR
ncbi:hypothetical protein [Longimicrobium sp.]|uniref:hypothetical protein n=1 Tax=Longimicrobium sp. TaxID=2029185 RepID=UPI003B3B2037